MHGRTVAAAVVVGALVASAASLPAAPAAQAAQACAPNLQRVVATMPQYVRAGDRFKLTMADDPAVFEYSALNASAEVGGMTVPVKLAADGTTTTVLRAPRTTGRLTVVVSWEQQPSDLAPDAPPCFARVPLSFVALAHDAVVGDLAAPRLEGDWTLLTTPIGWPSGRRRERNFLQLKPVCDVGACDVVMTNFAHRPRLRRGGDGVYRARFAPVYLGCLVRQMRDGVQFGHYTIARAFRKRLEMDLRISSRADDGDGLTRAARVTGEWRWVTEPTGRAAHIGGGCNRSTSERWRSVGTPG